MLHPVPFVAVFPKVIKCPKATKDCWDELNPDSTWINGAPQDNADARDEFACNSRRESVHHVAILGPDGGVEQQIENCSSGNGSGSAYDNSIALCHNNPGEKSDTEGKKEMRFDSTEP